MAVDEISCCSYLIDEIEIKIVGPVVSQRGLSGFAEHIWRAIRSGPMRPMRALISDAASSRLAATTGCSGGAPVAVFVTPPPNNTSSCLAGPLVSVFSS